MTTSGYCTYSPAKLTTWNNRDSGNREYLGACALVKWACLLLIPHWWTAHIVHCLVPFLAVGLQNGNTTLFSAYNAQMFLFLFFFGVQSLFVWVAIVVDHRSKLTESAFYPDFPKKTISTGSPMPSIVGKNGACPGRAIGPFKHFPAVQDQLVSFANNLTL